MKRSATVKDTVEDKFMLEDLNPVIYNELRANMEQFLQGMVTRIQSEHSGSIRATSPENRRINGMYSSPKTVPRRNTNIYQG